jgi:hypothetical protein
MIERRKSKQVDFQSNESENKTFEKLKNLSALDNEKII